MTSKTFRGFIVPAILLLSVSGCQDGLAKKAGGVESEIAAAPGAAEINQPTQPTKVTPPRAKSTIPAQAPRDPNEPAASIKIEVPEHDFGKIGPGSTHNYKFSFTNAGKAALKITRIDSSCSCTVPDLVKKEYATGESGTVEVNFHASAMPGQTTQHLYILSNDPVVPRAELVIKATVELKIRCEPDRLNVLLDKDNAGLESIKITSLDGTAFAVTSFTATNNSISAEFDSSSQATEQLIRLKADNNVLNTITNGVIQIGLSLKENPQVIVPFTVLPMFEISRPRIILPDIAAGEPQTKEVWIKSNYNKPIEIQSIESLKGYMEVVNQVAEGSNLRLDVKITPPGGRVRYFTDEMSIVLKGGQKLLIRASGWQRTGTSNVRMPKE